MLSPHISVPDGCTFHCFQIEVNVNVKICALLVNFYITKSDISCERTQMSCDYYIRVAKVLELNPLGY